jgi:hypothetical protein
MVGFRWGAVCILGGAMLGVPALAQDTGDVMPGETFSCGIMEEEGISVQVTFSSDTPGEVYLMLNSELITMAPVPTGSGFAYDATLPVGRFAVRGKGQDVSMTIDGGAPMTCTPNSAEPVTVLSATGNYSLGGKVRSGPGLDQPETDSLPFGEPVSILRHTGFFLDGYEWFEISYSEGLTGFQWGGVMCSTAMQIDGLYESCPAELQ